MDLRAQTAHAPDGSELCSAEWGDPDGVPVFSMHGTPGRRLLDARRIQLGFEPLVTELGVRLVTYDGPGCGRSDRQRGRTVAATANDVAAIADQLELERFAVGGGSSGSAQALAVAALLPERVVRLACVAPMAPYDELGSAEWSRDQLKGVRDSVEACLQGEDRAAEVTGEANSEMLKAG